MMILLLWLSLRWRPHIFKSICVVSVMKHLLGCERQPVCNIILYLWGLNVYGLSPRTLLTLSRYFKVSFYCTVKVNQFLHCSGFFTRYATLIIRSSPIINSRRNKYNSLKTILPFLVMTKLLFFKQ